MKRGEIYSVVPPRDFGKQRPAVIVQSPLFLGNATYVTFCLMTGSVQFINPMRILMKPTKTNGLDQPSLIQVDKIITVDGTASETALARLILPNSRRWMPR